jgi:hypothetical protein
MVSSLQEHAVLSEADTAERLAAAGAYPRPGKEAPSPDDDSDARLHQAEELVNFADGRREPLERLRSDYLRLLHADSGDLAATEALRVVETSLRLIPRPAGIYAWQRRWSAPKQTNRPDLQCCESSCALSPTKT